uniref:Mannitol repressor n=1 Tax=Candidatus Kentrum eta TaxID=2126337 RepID=A0A450VV53_9GAMM|nr:MAG: hypothetical protein BECKH772A_GA0070896_104873 [Candidatus Kentron sp. H]VFK05019.1 MAG: hypothetical protein BECKH772B_GA0070898_105192 [Candidatus Kentron sp. H]VFK08688.1 MAG: hypothetical protein BECKH772C_GA0070978_105392 [Candidatus Kentron sp. H]
MNRNLSKLIEWFVWANLDKKKDIELIILKGHLILKLILDNVLSGNNVEEYSKFSFYRKVEKLSYISVRFLGQIKEIAHYLMALNKIRNKLAHEVTFSIDNSRIDEWSTDVLSALEGMNFSKFTYRTKIVHTFSALAKALTEIEQKL